MTGMMARRSLIAYAAAGVLAIALIVGTVFFGWRHFYTDRLVDQARAQAPTAASRQAAVMLTYDYGSAKAELTKAADGLTGDFRNDYLNLVDKVIAPGAEQKQLTVKVDVRAAAVVTAEPDKATVLVFLNQMTTSKDNAQAVVTPSRVRMDMRKVNGQWLAASLQPI